MGSYSLDETNSTLHTANTNNHNTWAGTAKENVTASAEFLVSVFKPFPSQLSEMEEETVNNELNAPQQTASPVKKMRINKVKNTIQYKINPKKDPGLRLDDRKSS